MKQNRGRKAKSSKERKEEKVFKKGTKWPGPSVAPALDASLSSGPPSTSEDAR